MKRVGSTSNHTKPNALLGGAATVLLLLLADGAVAQTCTPKIPDNLLTRAGYLTFSTSPTLPPMQFVDQKGELKGMRVELGAEIAKRLCLKPDFIKVEYATMIPGLKGGRWDVIDAGLFVTPERLKVLYMLPYENLAISISTPMNGGKPIKSVDDLAGKAIAVDIGGYADAKARVLNADFKQRGLPEMTIRTFDGYASVYQALRAGQVDAGVSIDPVAKQYQDRGEFAHALHGLYPTPGSLAFGNKAIADAVAAAVAAMRADGSFGKLLDAYGVEPVPAADMVVQGSPG